MVYIGVVCTERGSLLPWEYDEFYSPRTLNYGLLHDLIASSEQSLNFFFILF